MRIVRWATDERVDVPDLTAMSFLVLGEFRRTVRTLVSGDEMYILRGFAVEPESPVSTRVKVALQPAGEQKGAAIGAELIDANADYGQIIGDRDSSFLDEGQAQQILDFSGQPNGAYTVELRFTYTDGVNDNRAFWQAGAGAEVVQLTDTRHVSGWQVQFVSGAPSGGEWIPLATVTWAGVTIAAGDIADLRALLFEGTSPFQRATQSAAGGVEDFDRSTSRADDAVGRFNLHDIVRALQRQIQDLKGAADDGKWDWFSRVYSPYDPAGALDANITKNLRSIDTVTYTVGDGVTSFGDFNGISGLSDCLWQLSSLADANRPERVEIVVHGSSLGAYVLDVPMALLPRTGDELTVTIRGGVKHTNAGNDADGKPTIQIDGASLSPGDYAVLVYNGGNLILRDLNVTWSGTTSQRSMFGADGFIDVERCSLQQTTPATDAGWILYSANARESRVSHCDIRGRVCLFNNGGAGSSPTELLYGSITHSRLLETQIVLHGSGGVNTDTVNGFVIQDCDISGRSSATYSGSVGLIDAASAFNLTVSRCHIDFGINEDAIAGYAYQSNYPWRWRIEDCWFNGDTLNGAAHAGGAGTGGASGTGWAVRAEGAAVATPAREIQVRNCHFTGTSVDAGGVRLKYGLACKIDGCTWEFCGHETSAGTETYTGVKSVSCERIAVTRCVANRWLIGMIGTCAFSFDDTENIIVSECSLDGADYSGGDITGRLAEANAIDIASLCTAVVINGNTFSAWEPGTVTAADSSCICSRAGGAQRLTIADNTFTDNGGYCIYFPNVGGCNDFTVSGNTVYVSTASGGAGFNFAPTGGLMRGSVTGNFARFQTAATDAILVGASGDLIATGNRFVNGVITTGGAVVWGFSGGGGPTNLNYIT